MTIDRLVDWAAMLESRFTVQAPPDATDDEVEAIARAVLIEMLKSGKCGIIVWKE